MRHIIALAALAWIATGTARGQQGTAPPSGPRAPAASASDSSRVRSTPPERRPRIYVPGPMKGGPVAAGLDGLDIPIDRKAYAGVPAQAAARASALTNVVLGAVSGDDAPAPGSELNPPGQPTRGGRFFINSGAIAAPGGPTGPQGRSVYTFTNESGGTSSILYDSQTGGATRYDYIGDAGRVYYGELPPGVRNRDPQIPSVTVGRGLGSLSGPGATFNADSAGPFGSGYAPTPPTPSVTPVNPTYTGGTYGIPSGLQAPSLGGPFSP